MSEVSRPAQLDHVALASDHAWDNLVRYVDHLGARWLGGPPVDGTRAFYFSQVELAGRTKLELLEPLPHPGSEFLRRFLLRNGPGPHHLTFKVVDFDDALASATAAGYDVIGVDRSNPSWMEAFLHPGQSHGIVIQLAHQGEEGDPWPEPGELPPASRRPPRLVAVQHLVADVEAARKLFTGPLAMDEAERRTDAEGETVVVTAGPWRLELTQPARSDWRHWMGNRPGRLLQLVLEVEEPGAVPGARPLGSGRYELAPEHNLGTRVRLQAPPPPAPAAPAT